MRVDPQLVAAVARLDGQGLPAHEISARIGRCTRTVRRYRALNRGYPVPRVSGAQRRAASHAAIEARIGKGRFAVRGSIEPAPVRERVPSELRYVEVGQCRGCKHTWRTNMTAGEVRQHDAAGKPCKGSHKLPLKRTVVLSDLYRPGEKWPKSWT